MTGDPEHFEQIAHTARAHPAEENQWIEWCQDQATEIERLRAEATRLELLVDDKAWLALRDIKGFAEVMPGYWTHDLTAKTREVFPPPERKPPPQHCWATHPDYPFIRCDRGPHTDDYHKHTSGADGRSESWFYGPICGHVSPHGYVCDSKAGHEHLHGAPRKQIEDPGPEVDPNWWRGGYVSWFDDSDDERKGWG